MQTQVIDQPVSRSESEELLKLRQQVAQLEDQLAKQAAVTNAVLAAAQDRVYWLDRWHLDLNKAMETRWGSWFRAALRAVRVPARQLRGIKRRIVRK